MSADTTEVEELRRSLLEPAELSQRDPMPADLPEKVLERLDRQRELEGLGDMPNGPICFGESH